MPLERYVCIHGHFYQPPRENPWLGTIEMQDGAAPFHDWNERITAECYRPNSRARILDERGRIHHIVNNYARMSFNFGPTLLSWLEEKAPDVYAAVLASDRESMKRFDGHGSAMAQSYGHTILPLTHSRDRRTQVIWGIRDFEHRFGRKPEGMWLPETAVDIETLELLAEAGIKFTVLAPHQAKRVRSKIDGWWQDVSDGSIDPRHPYEIALPSGRRLALFFYDGPASRAVAFEDVLGNGETFAVRLSQLLDAGETGPQLAHIATDGETYGHHHRFGEMALAYALELFETQNDIRLTNYGQFLALYPPKWEVEIQPNTSWSCDHGIERWRDDCGCSAGGEPGWSQAWRKPLRNALDFLHGELATLFERQAAGLLLDPWTARDDYIDVVLDRSPLRLARFLSAHAGRKLDEQETVRTLKLLELQSNAMLMFTSCGWFFNDLAGIETLQVLQYAGRALHLAEELGADLSLERLFLELLARARSNRLDYGDGAAIYERHVRTTRVDLANVAAHYAVSSLFDDYGARSSVHCYTVKRDSFELSEAGRMKLATGRVTVSSQRTLESRRMSFGVLHFGDQNIVGGVDGQWTARDFRRITQDLRSTFERADVPELVRKLDEAFPHHPFSLRSLFRDEQRRVVQEVLRPALDEAEAAYREVYRQNLPLMRFLHSMGYPLPNRFRTAAEITLNLQLRRLLSEERIDETRVTRALAEAELAGIVLDTDGLALVTQASLERMAQRLKAQPDSVDRLRRLGDTIDLVRALPFVPNLWEVQNHVWDAMQACLPDMRRALAAGDARGREWLEIFEPLAASLSIRLPEDGVSRR